MSVFHIEQDNLAQVDTGYLVPGTINQAYRAARGALSDGFEIEANGEVLPGWALSGNYTQFWAKDASGARINTLFAQQLLRIFSTYRFGGGLDGLTVGGGVNWEGLSYTDTTNPVTKNPERLKVEPYALVNLMARYQLRNGISVQANMSNLFDKKYYSQIGFYNQVAYGAPRSVMFTLRYQYR
ncbi:Putative OMR family iron-siderophore receptor precursor [hydrothermal vent metagenome]|uniref:OMR family iron-siderophore receptor n=1 Tax=hydrothermal vent metagenome TaxID=652676 RepID=A0A160TKC9_9ZZZZ